MNLNDALNCLPETDDKVIISHSGGLDSSTALILAVEKYGSDKVISLGFNYGQKQSTELEKAAELCDVLGVERQVLDLGILGQVVKNVSANIAGTDIEMPTIKDVLGDPSPKTEVPFRNLIMFSLSAAFAEANKAKHIVVGVQATDQYAYWDTTPNFVEDVNKVFSQNRKWHIQLIAPFSTLSKTDELNILKELGKVDLMKHTLTCYNPNEHGESCGKCPSCAERIKSFMDVELKDPIAYQVDIPWT